MVAVVTATIYIVLGLIVLSPALLTERTHTSTSGVTHVGHDTSGAELSESICVFPQRVDIHLH